MGRLIAIGDIHGRIQKLEGLLQQIQPTADDQLVFLGDYIDRGPDSYLVVETVIDLKERFPQTVTLRGNHEDFVISMFLGNQNPEERNIWLNMNGGNLCLGSYRDAGHFMAVHKDFYLSLGHSWETDEFFFCHAGIQPGVPLDEQRPIDLVDMREPFLSSKLDHGKVVVHGHSSQREVELLSNRINIDTGAGKHGPLTAIELPSRHLWQQW